MIYLASSWKNPHHHLALAALRAAGQVVYDFKNPTEGDNGFAWRQVTPDPKPWSLEKLEEVLRHPVAQRGFMLDFGAMQDCDGCVMLLPCGKSAHLEAGWFAGRGLPVVVWGFPGDLHEPELMYLCTAGVATTVEGVLAKLAPGLQQRTLKKFHEHARTCKDCKVVDALQAFELEDLCPIGQRWWTAYMAAPQISFAEAKGMVDL